MDATLRGGGTSGRSAASLIEFPGESASLLLGIVVIIGAVLLLSTATAGIFAVVCLAAILHIRLDEHRQRARMQLVTASGLHSKIFNCSKTAAFRLDVTLPPLYVVSDEEPNAYTSGFWGKHWIVLHSKLLSMLNVDELTFVIGHELGHVRREHVTWMVLTSGRSTLSGAILGPMTGIVLNSWSLKAEYAADRAGLLACRSFDTAARALIKITFWDGAVDFDGILRSALGSREHRPMQQVAELLGDHPFLANRLKRLREFHDELIRKGLL